jgi:hypothetical protein
MPIAPLIAHETWFTPGDAQDHYDWSFVWHTLPLTLLGLALIATVAARVIARWWPGIDIPFLGDMAPFMPFAIRMHLAVSLIGLVSLGDYLSPAMMLEKNAIGIILGAVMVIVAIGMATGWHARWAAWLLVIAGPLGMLEFGVAPVVQRLDLLALAVCILIWGPGRWSADHELGFATEPTLIECARAVWVLRMGVGGVLIIVAFAEKLANPELARHFLAERPYFNVFHELGFPMGDTTFLTIAGAVEVLFGLLIMSGALPQLGVLIVGVPFNATLWFFGTTELVGHLPVYGAMLVLLVYGSDPQLRPAVANLWPWRRYRLPAAES